MGLVVVDSLSLFVQSLQSVAGSYPEAVLLLLPDTGLRWFFLTVTRPCGARVFSVIRPSGSANANRHKQA